MSEIRIKHPKPFTYKLEVTEKLGGKKSEMKTEIKTANLVKRLFRSKKYESLEIEGKKFWVKRTDLNGLLTIEELKKYKINTNNVITKEEFTPKNYDFKTLSNNISYTKLIKKLSYLSLDEIKKFKGLIKQFEIDKLDEKKEPSLEELKENFKEINDRFEKIKDKTIKMESTLADQLIESLKDSLEGNDIKLIEGRLKRLDKHISEIEERIKKEAR